MLSWNGSPKSSILLGYLTKSTYKPFSCDSASLSWTPPDYSSATNLMAASREWWTLHPWWWNHILFTLSKFKRVISSIIFTLFHGESLYEMFFCHIFVHKKSCYFMFDGESLLMELPPLDHWTTPILSTPTGRRQVSYLTWWGDLRFDRCHLSSELCQVLPSDSHFWW